MKLWLVALYFALPGLASATTVGPALVSYQLQGSAFTGCVDGSRVGCDAYVPPFPSNDGTIRIDERLLPSRTMASQDLTFFYSTNNPDCGCTRVAGLQIDAPYSRFTPESREVSFTFHLETDAARDVVAWGISSYNVTGGNDEFVQTAEEIHWIPTRIFTRYPTYFGPGGTLELRALTPAPVPLPPSGLLAGAGIGGLVLASRRARRV